MKRKSSVRRVSNASRVSGSNTETVTANAGGQCAVYYVDGAAVAAAQRDVPPAVLITRAAEALRVIGNPARMRLLIALKDHELCVCDCASLLQQSVSAASQHLKELRRLGAVQCRQDGKLAYYRMDNARWCRIVNQALEYFSTEVGAEVGAEVSASTKEPS